jgi:hypothetical protein
MRGGCPQSSTAALVAVVAAAVVVSAAVAATHLRLSSPRVCSDESFSTRLGRCTRNQRGTALATNRFTCSVRVDADRPSTLAYRVAFDGAPVTGWQAKRVAAGSSSTWFSYDLGAALPLPGGSWTCTVAAGPQQVTIPFRTRGPSRPVVDLAICSGRHTVGSVRNGICRHDESAAGLEPTGTIVCSLLVLHEVGSVPRIELLDGTGNPLEIFVGSKVTETLWPLWGRATHPGTFPAGRYACRVSIDGRVEVTRAFTVRSRG